jgi:hypothetical protein
MTTEKKILKMIESTEAAAQHFIEEATNLKKMLGVVSTSPTTRKGKPSTVAAKVVSNRNKKIFQK